VQWHRATAVAKLKEMSGKKPPHVSKAPSPRPAISRFRTRPGRRVLALPSRDHYLRNRQGAGLASGRWRGRARGSPAKIAPTSLDEKQVAQAVTSHLINCKKTS